MDNPVWWTVEQSDIALAWAKQHRPAWYLWLLLSIRTGLRYGEGVALRWEDIQLNHRTPHILVSRSWSFKAHAMGPPKSGRQRLVPLTPATVAALREVPLIDRHELVCPPPSGNAPVRAVSGAVKFMAALVKATKLPRLRVHDLRHTYCSQLVSKGVDLNLVRQWAGHVDFATTLRYAHLSPLADADRAAVLDG